MNVPSSYNSAYSESQYSQKAGRQSANPSAHTRSGRSEPERLQEPMEDATGRIRVLIADDHGILRAGLAMLLQAQPDMELVGEAATGTEAIRAVEKSQPDIVLMDLAMPEVDGFEATRAITTRHPKVAVLALTMYESEEHFLKALEAGAAGFVPKRAASTDLMAAIRSVHRGDVFLYPSMAKTLLTKYLRRTPIINEVRHGSDGLTGRELEVLRLVADGLMNREIAVRLGVTESTVERHRSNIMEKLDLHSRTELIKYAVRKGIVQIDRSRSDPKSRSAQV